MSDDVFRGLLYVMDSLRFDHVGCNGYEKDITPTIDRIASDGTNFTSAFSQAIWTYPAAGSIFTGLYPETHGSQQFDQGLDPEQPHIADGFDDDVTTACFSTTLGVSPDRGFKQGFDEFYHIGKDDVGLRPDVMERLNSKLLPWLESNAGGAFFVVVWAMGTHHPYVTPSDEEISVPSKPIKQGVKGTQDWMRRLPNDRHEDTISAYNRAIEHTDEKLGEAIEKLEAQGVYDETSILVTADHGEIFNEHARLENTSDIIKKFAKTITSKQKRRYFGIFDESAFVGHQAIFPYDELIHVPLIVKPSTSNEFKSSRFDGLVELVDIFPTLYEFAELDLPSGVQGKSLSDIINGDTKSYVYSTSQMHRGNLLYRSIRGRKYKLCKKELFNISPQLVTDIRGIQSIIGYILDQDIVLLRLPTEKIDNTIEKKNILNNQLKEHISYCISQKKSSDEGKTVVIDEDTKTHLENLGYK